MQIFELGIRAYTYTTFFFIESTTTIVIDSNNNYNFYSDCMDYFI